MANVRKTVKETPDRISQSAPSRLRVLGVFRLVFEVDLALFFIMICFSKFETDELDRIWRELPVDHVWVGWAAVSDRPEAIWLYRSRQTCRRFELHKEVDGYVLTDEGGARIGTSASLSKVLSCIEGVPPRLAA